MMEKETMKRRIQKSNKKYRVQKRYYPHIVLLTLLAISIFISRSALKTNLTNFSRAQQGNFHLTEELYGANTEGGINFNVHVKFNFDGCDGDITLYHDGKFIAGPNAWNSFGGTTPFDYSEQYTSSPFLIPNDGQPHAISFRGAVNRCPKSPGTLWDEISCSVTFDSQGYPQISPSDKCEIKNLSEIKPVPFTTSKIIPTSPLTPIPTNTTISNPPPPPRSTPGVEARETNSTTIIQFMGIKLGKLTSTQPLNILWFIIDAFGKIFQAK